MALSTLIRRNSIRTSSLTESVDSLTKNFNKSISITNNIAKDIAKQNQIKSSSISDSSKFFQRRREAVRRKEQEGIIEASSVSGVVRKTGKAVMDSTKGFMGRILDFVGTLMVGWLLINLPVIIDGVKKLGERIKQIVSVLGTTITDISSFLSGFGQLISGALTNLLTFNFTDSEGKVRNATNQMTQSLNAIYSDITEVYRLFSTPLDFGLDELFDELDAAERNAPGMIPSEGGYEEPSDQIQGGRISPQAVYQYLRSLGVGHVHAMGILANIQGESSFQVGVKQKGGPGVGLFQYSSAGRKDAFLRAVPDYKTNWKGQVRYAISEDAGPAYLKTSFNTPEEAASWWMRKWERPAAEVRSSRDKEHNAFIKNFRPPQPSRPSGNVTSAQIQAPSLPSGRLRGGQNVSAIGQGVGNIVITDNYGARGGSHKGIDIAAPHGTYIAVRGDAQVVASGRYGNYGLVIDVWLIEQRVQLRFAHCSEFLITSGRIPAGTSFARVGSTGRSSGPHIHFEYSKTYNKTNYGGDGDASAYVPLILLTKYKNGGRSAAVVSPSKQTRTIGIDSTKSSDVSSLTTRRKGANVIIAQPQQPAQKPAPIIASGGGPAVESGSGNSLNTLMVGRLLLDLAYN